MLGDIPHVSRARANFSSNYIPMRSLGGGAKNGGVEKSAASSPSRRKARRKFRGEGERRYFVRKVHGRHTAFPALTFASSSDVAGVNGE